MEPMSAKELLDQLMGKQRDVPVAMQRTLNYFDKEIDKFWLCGIEPFELFRNTPWAARLPDAYRRATGRDWTGVAIDQPAGIKEQWDAQTPAAKEKHGYELDCYKFLDELVRTNDRTVQRARSQHEKAAMELTDSDASRLRELEEDIRFKTKAAEAAGEAGEVEESLDLMKRVEEAQRLKDGISKQPADATKFQKMVVCEVSGASGLCSLSKNMLVCEVSGNVVQNTEVRIQEHYSGRIYLSWKAVRDKLAELNVRLGPLPAAQAARDSRVRGRDDDEPRGGRADRAADDRAPDARAEFRRPRSPPRRHERSRSKSPKKRGTSRDDDRRRRRDDSPDRRRRDKSGGRSRSRSPKKSSKRSRSRSPRRDRKR
ncbi:hypothetical protein M885DRAFT_544973 [Pelagophyceae sp. CCMP2097]|nr:hypothetical protein M885DRAFT_544973 [Pelagophyceae sp. CCMP2097]